MPPAAWISSSARSKPCFHCAPYCAFGPVKGPLTPSVIGSEESAKAARETAVPASMAASDPLTKLRRLKLLMRDSIQFVRDILPIRGNFHAIDYFAGAFVGSPRESISRFAQLKNAALFMTSTI